MSEFTPGPWTWDEELAASLKAEEGRVFESLDGATDCVLIHQETSWPIALADKHLIAAAPALYEALDNATKVLSTMEFNGVPAEVAMPELWAALALARGETG